MSLALGIVLAAAAPFADLDLLDREIARFTGAATGEAGGAIQPLDRRLRLRSCASAPALSWRTARRDTVVVRCADSGGWQLFVPVQAAQSLAPAVPAGPVINRGDGVTIAVVGQGFAVSRQGEALEAGAAGAWIKVRPAGEDRAQAEAIRAKVVRPGLVAITLD